MCPLDTYSFFHYLGPTFLRSTPLHADLAGSVSCPAGTPQPKHGQGSQARPSAHCAPPPVLPEQRHCEVGAGGRTVALPMPRQALSHGLARSDNDCNCARPCATSWDCQGGQGQGVLSPVWCSPRHARGVDSPGVGLTPPCPPLPRPPLCSDGRPCRDKPPHLQHRRGGEGVRGRPQAGSRAAPTPPTGAGGGRISSSVSRPPMLLLRVAAADHAAHHRGGGRRGA